MNLPKFATLGDPGAADPRRLPAQTAGPEARRLRRPAHRPGRHRQLARSPSATTSPPCWTRSTKTQGFQNLMDFIYNTIGSINGFDAVRPLPALEPPAHHLRRGRGHAVQSGCEAFFRPATTAADRPRRRRARRRKVRKAKLRSALAAAAGRRPEPPGPAAASSAPRSAATDARRSGSGADSGLAAPTPTTTTTTPDEPSRTAGPNQAVSMREASMFLQFLLGGGA